VVAFIGKDQYSRAMRTPLSSLPPSARIRLTSIAPALTAAQGDALIAALEKLAEQFVREGRITQFALELLGENQVLAFAWENVREPLSGCSHDKFAQILQLHEEKSGVRLLQAPPIVIATTDGLRCVDRAQLKHYLRSGVFTPQHAHWNLRTETVGEWLSDGIKPANETWLAPIVQRLLSDV
jgi:hypothetical protein